MKPIALSRNELAARLRRGHYEYLEQFNAGRTPAVELRARAMDLVALASRPDARGLPHRVCAFDHLASAFFLLDRPGYAGQILQTCSSLLEEVTSSEECRYCLLHHVISSLRTLGRTQEAADQVAEALVELKAARFAAAGHCRYYMRTLAGMISLDEGAVDVAAARLGRAPEAEQSGSLIVRAERVMATVRLLLARDEWRNAAREAEETFQGFPPIEALADIALLLAEHAATREDWLAARLWAQRAASVADRLGAWRRQAEAHLMLAECAEELGAARELVEHRSFAQRILPLLRSRDLDGRLTGSSHVQPERSA